jgi:hypothetical protein
MACFPCKQNTVELQLDVTDVESGTEGLSFGLLAKSAGEELTPRDNSRNLTLRLKTQADIELIG